MPVGPLATRSAGGQVDPVTGATYSTVGVVTAVNRAVEIYQNMQDEIRSSFQGV
jgi:electron transport complex protein RnfG